MKKLGVEALEDRLTPSSASAIFSGGVLVVEGTNHADNILVSAVAGQVSVTNNNQVVPIRSVSATPTIANTTLIFIYGNNGDDVLRTDHSLDTVDASGLVTSPDVVMYGGNGNDVLAPGNGGIVGGAAGITNGVVTGKVVGNAYMDGGNGNDTLISGFGNDFILGGHGDDAYVWPPGTLTDYVDLGEGHDTGTIVDGGAGNYVVTTTGTSTLVQRVTGVQFSVLFDNTESIFIQTNGVVTYT